jgi:protein YIPF5/7
MAAQSSFQPAIFTPSTQPQSNTIDASASASTVSGGASAGSFPQSQGQPQARPTQGSSYNLYSQPQAQAFPQQSTQPATSSYGFDTTQSANDFSGWMNTSAPASFSGSMDSGAATFSTTASATSTPSYFTPQLTTNMTSGGAMSTSYSSNDFLDEPPLLEELGINMEHILFKTKAVVLPFARLPFLKSSSSTIHAAHSHDNDTSSIIIKDADLAGPLVFALLLGAELLVTGKLHSFGYIYGLSVFGCGCLALILNLMKGPLGHAYDHTQMQSASLSISIWTTTSILGYALLPVNVLAGVKILFTMMLLQHNTTVMRLLQILGVLTVLWSTTASTRLLEVGCDMRAQRYLIAYPIALLYSAFVLVTIF